jgi:hypothetical protein
MKKIAILLFAVITAISCSKDDAQTPEPVANTALKVFNKTTGAEIKDGDVVTFNSISIQFQSFSYCQRGGR